MRRREDEECAGQGMTEGGRGERERESSVGMLKNLEFQTMNQVHELQVQGRGKDEEEES